jgi:hypothetical protein
MADITKHKGSASTNGRAVKIAATASAGTLLHTATNVAGEQDEVYVYVYNSDTVPREVTVQWGGTTSPDDDIKLTIPPKAGLITVVPGLLLMGGLELRAYGAAANVLTAHVFVNRIVNG